MTLLWVLVLLLLLVKKYGDENMMCIGSELSEAQVNFSKERLFDLRSKTIKTV